MTGSEFEFEYASNGPGGLAEVLDAAGFDDRVPSHETAADPADGG